MNCYMLLNARDLSYDVIPPHSNSKVGVISHMWRDCNDADEDDAEEDDAEDDDAEEFFILR